MNGRLNAGLRWAIGEVAGRWFAPLLTWEAWAATGYLAAAALVATVWFAIAALVAVISIPLTIVVIGVPAATGLLALPVKLGSVDRRRARWVGREIPEPTIAGAGSRAAWRARLGDAVRWRALAFFASSIFVHWALLALAVAPWGASLFLITFPIWGWAVGVGPLGLVVSVIVGAVLVGLGPRAAVSLADVSVGFTRSLLGPDQIAVMRERVDRLATNRSEILAAVASERRRIEHNLHDGVQQLLLAAAIDLGLAANKIEADPEGAAELLRAAAEKNRAGIGELRAIGRGLHPAILDDRGLDAALSAVVAGSPFPIELVIEADLDLTIDTAETAYFVVSEAVANMLKHAGARTGSVEITEADGVLRIRVADDGRGGANPSRGTGLAGIAARVGGVDGTFEVSSPDGGPTVIDVRVPHG